MHKSRVRGWSSAKRTAFRRYEAVSETAEGPALTDGIAGSKTGNPISQGDAPGNITLIQRRRYTGHSSGLFLQGVLCDSPALLCGRFQGRVCSLRYGQ